MTTGVMERSSRMIRSSSSCAAARVSVRDSTCAMNDPTARFNQTGTHQLPNFTVVGECQDGRGRHLAIELFGGLYAVVDRVQASDPSGGSSQEGDAAT